MENRKHFIKKCFLQQLIENTFKESATSKRPKENQKIYQTTVVKALSKREQQKTLFKEKPLPKCTTESTFKMKVLPKRHIKQHFCIKKTCYLYLQQRQFRQRFQALSMPNISVVFYLFSSSVLGTYKNVLLNF